MSIFCGALHTEDSGSHTVIRMLNSLGANQAEFNSVCSPVSHPNTHTHYKEETNVTYMDN